jgi:hypothetical protein
LSGESMLANRLGIFLHVTTLSAALALGCSGKVEYNGASGGSPSNIDNSGSSGGSASTGGSASIADLCNGLFKGQVCDSSFIRADITADGGASQYCDIPLSRSPPDPQVIMVAIDCQLIPLVPNNDIYTVNVGGFVIDYRPIPAHLILRGSSCTNLQVPGVHYIDFIEGCIHPI